MLRVLHSQREALFSSLVRFFWHLYLNMAKMLLTSFSVRGLHLSFVFIRFIRKLSICLSSTSDNNLFTFFAVSIASCFRFTIPEVNLTHSSLIFQFECQFLITMLALFVEFLFFFSMGVMRWCFHAKIDIFLIDNGSVMIFLFYTQTFPDIMFCIDLDLLSNWFHECIWTKFLEWLYFFIGSDDFNWWFIPLNPE